MSVRDRLLEQVLESASSLDEQILRLAELTAEGRWEQNDIAWVRDALLDTVRSELS